MNIVSPILETNSVSITPRYYDDVGVNLSYEFEDEDTRVLNNITISGLIKADCKLTFDVETTFIENTSYKLTITDNDLNEIIYRGLLFATDQTPQNYQING